MKMKMTTKKETEYPINYHSCFTTDRHRPDIFFSYVFLFCSNDQEDTPFGFMQASVAASVVVDVKQVCRSRYQ
jgi:hypothetical protein